MRKVLLSIIGILLVANIYAASTFYILNVSSDYTLYYNFDAQKPSDCYPRIQATNANCSYLTIPPYGSVIFSSYSGLQSSYYPNLEVLLQVNSSVQQGQTSIAAADALLNANNMNWSLIRYIGEDANQNGDGAWVGFSDFYSCHGCPSTWGTTGNITNAVTSFTVGGDRFFIMSQF